MNIHFTNESFFKELQENSLVKLEVGSKMYGFDNANSDVDYLYIYLRPYVNDTSFVWEFQPLQYKEDGVDHIFVDLNTFVKHVMTGESTLFFEALHELNGTSLQRLYDYRKWFYSYNVIKSYLGLAKRDFKKVSDSITNEYVNYKKLHHGVRGYWSAQMVLEGQYSNQWREMKPETYDAAMRLKDGKMDVDPRIVIDYYQNWLQVLRVDTTRKLELGKINRIMDPAKMDILDQTIRDITEITPRCNFHLDMHYFYEALENGIKY